MEKGGLALLDTVASDGSDADTAAAATARANSTFSPTALEKQEHVADVLRLRQATGAGIVIWCLFAVVDVVAAMLLQPDALLWLLLIRGVAFCVAMPLVLRLRRPPLPSRMTARLCDVFVFGIAACAISLMTVRFQGLVSPYVAGLCVALVARGAFVIQPWQRGVLPMAVIALSFPTVIGISLPFSTMLQEQMADPLQFGHAVVLFSMVIGVGALSLLASHRFWQIRRQAMDRRVLGKYVLEKRIGAGAMGEVWRARAPGGSAVAIKIMRAPAGDALDAIVRFEREITAMARLRNPHAVRVLDFGVSDRGLWFYTMELLEGEDLAACVQRLGRLPHERAVSIGCQVAEALAEAHQHGIVHRDVKPANVILVHGQAGDQIKVVDFGIAQLDQLETITQVGELLGTPAYMAPEVARGERADSRADVYAVGALLYHLLTGFPPFEGTAVSDVLVAVATRSPQPPSERVEGELPKRLEEIVMQCLAKDPALRPADGAALLDALRDTVA